MALANFCEAIARRKRPSGTIGTEEAKGSFSSGLSGGGRSDDNHM